MTAQFHDSFTYKSKMYSLSCIEFPEYFFNIRKLGLIPIPECTACWRGYVAGFALDQKNRLLLKDLVTSHDSNRGAVPIINGLKPTVVLINKASLIGIILKYGLLDLIGNYRYNGLSVMINYSGRIVITKDFIHEKFNNIGFQSPLSYNEIVELTFVDGICITEKDYSDIAREKWTQKKSNMVEMLVSFWKTLQGRQRDADRTSDSEYWFIR